MVSLAMAAIERDGMECVRQLSLEADTNGHNALHVAVLMGHGDMAALLLDTIGLRMDCVAKDGSTVLHLASRSNLSNRSKVNVDSFYDILVSHCNQDILSMQDSFGMTPTHNAGLYNPFFLLT